MMLRAFLCFTLLALAGSARADQWALIVGISNYEDAKHISSPPTANADAKLIAKTLREVWQVPETNITLLTSDGSAQPTRANLLTSLATLKRNVKPGDTVFMYVSAYALSHQGSAYLLPQDIQPRSFKSTLETSVDTKLLTDILQQLRGAAVFVAWDIWQGDIMRTIPKPGPLTPTKEDWSKCVWGRFPNVSSPVADQITELYACSPRQRSYPQPQGQVGYFAQSLAQGLRGDARVDGSITAQSLADFVIREVTSNVLKNEREQQTPYRRVLSSKMDSVLVSTPLKQAGNP